MWALASLVTIGAVHQDPRQILLGTWRGSSTCTGARAACRAETVVYHITAGPKPDVVTVVMNKLEDGREVEMGALDFKVDFAGRRLTGTYDSGRVASLWTFHWTDAELRGTAVVLPSRTKTRDIVLARR